MLPARRSKSLASLDSPDRRADRSQAAKSRRRPRCRHSSRCHGPRRLHHRPRRSTQSSDATSTSRRRCSPQAVPLRRRSSQMEGSCRNTPDRRSRCCAHRYPHLLRRRPAVATASRLRHRNRRCRQLGCSRISAARRCPRTLRRWRSRSDRRNPCPPTETPAVARPLGRSARNPARLLPNRDPHLQRASRHRHRSRRRLRRRRASNSRRLREKVGDGSVEIRARLCSRSCYSKGSTRIPSEAEDEEQRAIWTHCHNDAVSRMSATSVDAGRGG